MSKIISEYDGKRILDFWLPRAYSPELRSGTLSSAYSIPDNLSDVEPGEFDLRRACNEAITVDLYAIEKYIEAELKDLDGFKKYLGGLFAAAAERSPWVKTEKLVCKVDQAIKGRGKLGLVALNKTWEQVCAWITEVSSKRHNIGLVEGYIVSYTIEPFHPHVQEEEFYLSIGEERECDTVLFSIHGGMDIGDADARCKKLSFPLKSRFSIQKKDVYPLLTEIKSEKIADAMAEFIKRLLVVFECLYFSMIEINPLVVKEIKSPEGSRIEISILDLAAKLDSAAFFECSKLWLKSLSNTWRSPAYPAERLFPRDFGRISTREEEYIEELDSKTGASLKFTILNPNGRIWTLVAGGGASVVYADAIASLGYSSEMANYGEYSGAPGESQTYEYSKTIIDLMTRCPPHKDGKILFIGGGIANFTNVVSTFKGIVAAITEYRHALKAQKVKIYVRRAGPNYQEGLKLMRSLGESLDLFIKVYGPESPITEMVPIALGKKVESSFKRCKENKTNGYSIPKLNYPIPTSSFRMTSETTAIVYGMQPRAVQGMLDFDYLCKRSTPSVACIVYPFGGHYFQKFYLGTNEILIPVFTSISKAREKFPKVNTVINFSSFRSVYSSTMQIMSMPGVEMVTIIAEGVPMKHSRHIIQSAKQKNILILGPATVGGISAGRFKIGNTGGMMDNIIASKLYRPGSVSYVSKSGGMSNELNNIISNCADGVCEGVAIGGDRYPGSVFMDHIYRYENDPMCKIIVLLGEIGGVEELYVAEAIKNKHVTKPVIVWCIGTCADLFKTNIQFGHAGSLASSALETSVEKNRILKLAGAYVPDTFEEIPQLISSVYNDMVKSGVIKKFEEPEVPKIPIDYAWAQELGLIRKPASFISTICDDRGEELLYAGMTINDIFNEDIGIGGVLSLLWFKRRLPSYATEFIEMVLMIIADHGPAVSGAHNTIVTARAGKDLISSLVSGLLTIGDRFGGALDGAARDFSAAYDQNLSPAEFVDKMRKENKLILGIGHKIKSLSNPDHRVRLIKKYVKEKFPFHNTLDYALEVEKITTSKKDNLILNVDGVVGAAFVDLLRGSGAFSPEEAEEYISIGTLNGLFVLGRSIGFIGHFLDQKRLKQGLYRHPWDDISYMSPENSVKDSERTRTLAESSIVMERGPGMQ